jgi:AbrB family looped-hinge helix DNA binding protein
MLNLTYKILKVELIKGSSTRVTIPKEIRDRMNINLGDKIYIGLTDKEYSGETLLEISAKEVSNVDSTIIAENGRIVIPMALATKIRNLQRVGIILCNNRIFFFSTDAMKEKTEYNEKEMLEIEEKVKKIANI